MAPFKDKSDEKPTGANTAASASKAMQQAKEEIKNLNPEDMASYVTKALGDFKGAIGKQSSYSPDDALLSLKIPSSRDAMAREAMAKAERDTNTDTGMVVSETGQLLVGQMAEAGTLKTDDAKEKGSFAKMIEATIKNPELKV